MRGVPRERGAASLLILAVAVFVVILGLMVADLSVYLAARARAQVAADAAALAAAPVTFRSFGAAGSPADEARRFSAGNGGTLLECRCAPDPSWRSRNVTVLVSVPADLVLLGATEARAWSSAEFDPTRLGR